MEGLPEGVDSRFRYVLLVSKRAEQLIQGSNPKMRFQSFFTLMTVQPFLWASS